MPLDFTDDALGDLQAISRYALMEIGPAAADYIEEFDRAFDRLERYPNLGRLEDALAPGIRIMTVRQHRIFYRVLPSSVLIVRILHHRLNITID